MQAFLHRHRFLISFAFLSTLMGTSVGMAKVATSLFALELHANDVVLGAIAASQTVGSLLISLPIGALVDRVGPARPFIVGSVAAGLLYVLVPFAPTALVLLVANSAISFFMPMRFVSLNTLFMHEIVQIGVEKAGWYRGTHMVGMMLLGPVVSVATTRALGFHGTYWLIAGLFALTVLVCPIVFARYGRGQRPAAESGTAASRRPSVRELAGQFRTLSEDPELRKTALVEFAAQSLNAFFSFFIVIIVVSDLALGEAFATRLLGVEGGAFMLALFCFGGFVSRVGEERVYGLSFAVVATALTVLGLGRGQWLLTLGSAVLGLGLGSLQIVNLTRFAFIGGRLGRGKVSGLTPFVGTTGSLLGSLLGGVIGHTLGLQYVFLVYAVAFVGLLLAMRRVRASEPPRAALDPDVAKQVG
ncbi:MAG: MFS transporter [Polyangiales bacterium]